MSDIGQYVTDWADVNFGRRFANNKFRDGSAFAPPPAKATVEQSTWIVPFLVVLAIAATALNFFH